MTATNKKVHIKTYGCQMNVYDSGRMADLLVGEGYAPCDTPEEADMVILNTCHIREKAAEKVYSELGRLKSLKDAKAAEGDRMIIAVAGCVAQAEGEEMIRRAPVVDLVFGPQTYHRLPDMVRRINDGTGTARLVDTDFPVEEKFDFLPEESAAEGPSRFLTIQEGCDKFCTFCVVPYTRGAEVSRAVTAVEAEARRLAETGAREITLLGQNVNAYHGTGPDGRPWSLGALVTRLAEIDGVARLRYTTSHPRDVDESLVTAHRDVPELVPFLHLPVQSGADRILAAMNRRHTADDYRRIAESLFEARPDLKLSSDFIVGFPGETEADFKETLRLVRDMGFIQAFSFKYSARPGTPAADSADAVPEDVKTARLAELQALLEEQQAAFNQRCLGSEMEILFDGRGRHAGQALGRTAYMQPVHVDAADTDALMGQLARVRITEVHANSLHGELLEVGHDRPHHDDNGAAPHRKSLSEKVELRT